MNTFTVVCFLGLASMAFLTVAAKQVVQEVDSSFDQAVSTDRLFPTPYNEENDDNLIVYE